MFNINQKNQYILRKQVEPLFKATLVAGLGNILASILVLFLLNETKNQANAISVCTLIITISVIRIFVSRSYLNNKNKIRTYLNSHFILTLIIGISWGFIAFIQLYTNDDTLRNLIFLLNFGLIAASIATLSSWMPAYIAFMLPQSLAIFYVFSAIDSEYNFFMVTAFLIYMFSMIITSLRFNKSHQDQIQLIVDNKELIGDLSNEIEVRENVQYELEQKKSDLEINKLQLEDKVDERTKELNDINQHLEKVIIKKEQAEQSLQYLAYHDELTGLPNKNLLVDRINQSIKTSSRDSQQMAILFLDLDRFKTINDSLGHTIGDKLIQSVSTRLLKALRNHDTISRNGGDEFVVVLEGIKNTDEAIHVAKKVINCLTDTFDIDSHKIHIGASIGISIYPTDGNSPLILLRNADTAMYRAKKAGGNQLQFYDKSMSNQLRDRLELENELHNALEKNEFYMVYQPQVNCNSGITIGFESLIRWKNNKHGEIGPDRFIPLLEETGLIYDVGNFVVKKVISFISTHHINNVRLSINLSALQCDNLEFVDFVTKEINKAGIKPSLIEFEITESLLIKDFEKTKTFLDKLHSAGCSIALDDFGTGYTSMSYLARLPIDVIKIDKSFVRDIHLHDNLKIIVRAIVTMSKSLGKSNIFEGVETNDELAEVKKMDGTIIQGFLYSKPLKEHEVDEWLNAENAGNAIKLA